MVSRYAIQSDPVWQGGQSGVFLFFIFGLSGHVTENVLFIQSWIFPITVGRQRWCPMPFPNRRHTLKRL